MEQSDPFCMSGVRRSKVKAQAPLQKLRWFQHLLRWPHDLFRCQHKETFKSSIYQNPCCSYYAIHYATKHYTGRGDKHVSICSPISQYSGKFSRGIKFYDSATSSSCFVIVSLGNWRLHNPINYPAFQTRELKGWFSHCFDQLIW